MAMNAAAIRTALGRIGFSVEARNAIVNEQEINTLEELRLLDDDAVSSLCRVVRRPGGHIVNQAGNNIADYGIKVSMRAETNLKLACYWLRHKERVSRDVAAADFTLDNVRSITQLRVSEEAHEDPEPPTVNIKDWAKTFDALKDYFRSCLGETGIPLAYVIRESDAIVADPADGYDTVTDEMIARAPHVTANGDPSPIYLNDRRKVWDKFRDICHDIPECWTYIKSAARAKNGRAGYEQLYDHYLGPNNVDNQASIAESRLQKTFYQGEKKRWNFEKFVRLHVDQHSILDGLVEHGYSGIDEGSKVRHLLNGIRDPSLNAVKTQILADARLRGSFTDCVRLYNDFLRQKSTLHPNGQETNLSSVSTTGDGVEDRYYSKEEYSTLSHEQKDALRLKRLKRGHKSTTKQSGGGGDDGGKTAKKAKKAKTKSKVSWAKKISTQLAAISSKISNDDEPTDDEDEPPATDAAATGSVSNRNNAALTRQKKK